MLAEDYARDRISLTMSEEEYHKSYQPHSVRGRLRQILDQSHNVRGRLCQKSHQFHNVRGRLTMPRIASISRTALEKDYLAHRTHRGMPQKDCDPDRINHRKS